jgi:hypothetical protein
MLFRGRPSGGAETRRAHGRHTQGLVRRTTWPMRSRIFPAPGAACLSLAVTERTRRQRKLMSGDEHSAQLSRRLGAIPSSEATESRFWKRLGICGVRFPLRGLLLRLLSSWGAFPTGVALPMPRNTNGRRFSKDMTGTTFPQGLSLRDDLRLPYEKDKKALPGSHKQRDHVSKPDGGEAAEFGLGGLLNTAIEIATERRALLGAIKSALERRDCPEVLRLVSKLCGANDEKSGGTHSGIN